MTAPFTPDTASFPEYLRTVQRESNFSDYLRWLEGVPAISLDDEYRTHFEKVLSAARRAMEQSPTWRKLEKRLPDIDGAFQLKTGFRLVADPSQLPQLETKPYSSFLEKTYRKNVSANPCYPEPPPDGWFLPDEWFSRIHDLVRTTFHVRYLDGVVILAEALGALCDEDAIPHKVNYEAREEGYYAAHFLGWFNCEVPRLDFDTESRVMTLEVHVATQVQGVVHELLHPLYERRRLDPDRRAGPRWQWDYASNEFALNYLGHISHYMDGMIVGLRDKLAGSISQDGTTE